MSIFPVLDSSSKYAKKLSEDGDTLDFALMAGHSLEKSEKVWESGKPRAPKPSDDPKTITTRFSHVVIIDGAISKLEQSKTFWTKVSDAATKAGGSPFDHVYQAERIGEKGDTKTTYRIKVVGAAPKVETPPTLADLTDTQAEAIFGKGALAKGAK